MDVSSPGEPDPHQTGADVEYGTLSIVDHLLYPAAFVPWLLYYSLYTLKQGSPRDLIRVLKQRFGGYPPSPDARSQTVWIHGVSVGEINCIPPVVDELASVAPSWTPVVTASTLTGHQMAQDHFPNRETLFFPVDYPGPVKRAFRHVRPDLIMLIEQEIWPAFMRESVRRGVPVVVVNGRMTERSAHRFGALPERIRNRMFQPLAAVLAQNEAYAKRFHELGVHADRIHVTGNVKYDAMTAGRPDEFERETLRARYGITPDQQIVIGGSIHPPEHLPLLDALKTLRNRDEPTRLILAPRHLKNADQMYREAEERGFRVRFDGDLEGSPAASPAEAEVIVIDRIGLLMTLYSVSDLVFVGGSLIEHGGQNMLEPAIHGAPVLVGPHTFNFTDDVKLLHDAGGVRVVSDGDELTRVVENHPQNERALRNMGKNAREAVLQHRGAARRSVRYLDEHSFFSTDGPPLC